MFQNDSRRLFQGSELPRLVVLATIAATGCVVLWGYAGRGEKAPDPVEVVSGGPPPALEPDRSPEFETVTDKTSLTFRENAAYAKLLDQARDATPARLAEKARRDVFFTHLWERPASFRGVPVHLIGTARRVLRYESKLSRTGWLYEAWMFTPDSQSHPLVCVFEDAPQGFPIGANLSERVVFNGYFLKLMRYEASDLARAAPLLVGRIGWAPPTVTDAPFPKTYVLMAVVALMFMVSLGRWLLGLRRTLTKRPDVSRFHRPTEEIDPESLADWVDSVAEADDAGPDPPNGALRRDVDD